jgi:hypothetical protein
MSTMLSERLQLKIYLHQTEHFELEALIPVFHRFIRDRSLAELMIDVVDYSHVSNGPGVVLIGHAADYYVGELDGAFGLVFSRKRSAPPAETRLSDAFQRLLNVAHLLEREGSMKLEFRTNQYSLRLTDRLHAPSDAASFEEAKIAATGLLGRLYEGAAISIERHSEPRGPLGLDIKIDASPAIETLLAKLGGPPTT